MRGEQAAPATLVYAHDPMCSWCWAFLPVGEVLRERLQARHEGRLRVKRLLGGLAPDSDEPMPEPMQQYLQQTWASIQERVPGTRFNFDFWTRCQPRRSTWPACRAVVAARRQDARYDIAMTRAIQEAYYLQARNPSERKTLVALAAELGLERERFETDLDSDDVRTEFEQEMALVRRMGIRGFPGLMLVGDGWGAEVVVDYANADRMAEDISARLEENGRHVN